MVDTFPYGGRSGFVSLEPPEAPENLAVESVGDGFVTLTWEEVDDASSYGIFVGTSSGQEQYLNSVQGAQSTTQTVTGLTDGTEYFFYVKAFGSGGGQGFGLQSNEVNATPFIPAPMDLEVTDVQDGQVSLSWTGTGSHGYNVYVGTYPGMESDTPATSTAGSTTVATVFDLEDGTEYYFVVKQIGISGQVGPASNEVSATPVIEPPASFSAMACDGHVTLGWSTSLGAVTYSIYQGTTPGGEGGSPVQDGITGLSTVVNGLTDGTTYYFKVSAVGLHGESAKSTEVNAKPIALGAPSGLQATPSPSAGTITLTWNAGSNAATYNVLRSTTSGDEEPIATGISITGYIDNDVMPGMLYYYTIKSENSCGQTSAASNEASAEISAYQSSVLADSPLSYITGTEESGGAFINLGSLGTPANWQNSGATTGATILSDGYAASSMVFAGGADTGGGAFLQVINASLADLFVNHPNGFTLEYWLSSGGSGPALGWTALNQGATGQNTANTAGLYSSDNFPATSVDFGAFKVGGSYEYTTAEGSANSGQRIFVSLSSDGEFMVNGVNQLFGTQSQSYSADPNGMWFGQTWDGGDFDWRYLDAAAQHIAVYGAVVPASHRTARYGIGIGGGNGFTEAQNITQISYLSLSNANRTLTRNATSTVTHAAGLSLHQIPAAAVYAEAVLNTVGGSTADSFSVGIAQLYLQGGPIGGSIDAPFGIGYSKDGKVLIQGTDTTGFPTLADGDVVNMWIDNVAGEGWFGKNNVPLQGNPQTATDPDFTFTPGTWFVAMSLADTGDIGTLNLNTDSLAYPLQGRFSPMLP